MVLLGLGVVGALLGGRRCCCGPLGATVARGVRGRRLRLGDGVIALALGLLGLLTRVARWLMRIVCLARGGHARRPAPPPTSSQSSSRRSYLRVPAPAYA
jgi:hypothetical protein